MTNQEKFDAYAGLLKDWNSRVNLTAVTDDDEIRVKHFMDSLTILPYLEGSAGGGALRLVDVGTGAGFPGIPVAIERPEIEVTLVDSLEKRVRFLECVARELDLKNVRCVHGRAEDLGRDPEYRETFDFATARAVASMPVLLEYCLPFLKDGGKFIAMKGANAGEEEFSGALKKLGGRLVKEDYFTLEGTDMKRCIFVVEKRGKMPAAYPRKAGLPAKKPL